MKAKKTPAGNYRIQYYVDGKRKSYTFDHNPTQKEIKQIVYGAKEAPKQPHTDDFITYANKYIDIKTGVLSPSTIRSYYAVIKKLPVWFNEMYIEEITQTEAQRLISELTTFGSPKTVRNYYGFVSSVIRFFYPDKDFKVTFPAKKKPDDYIPTAEDVKKVLEVSKTRDLQYYIVFSLGCFGLRRSEILPLTLNDIGADYVDINKTKVQNSSNRWITKDIGKTETSLRRVPIPTNLAELIRSQGFIYNRHPDKILENLHKCQELAGVPRFRFHLLRHFFCTELSQAGFSESDIMALGGWSTPHVMKKVYRHQRIMENEEAQKKVATTISNLIN